MLTNRALAFFVFYKNVFTIDSYLFQMIIGYRKYKFVRINITGEINIHAILILYTSGKSRFHLINLKASVKPDSG